MNSSKEGGFIRILEKDKKCPLGNWGHLVPWRTDKEVPH